MNTVTIPQRTILLAGLLQGLALGMLGVQLDAQLWPFEQPVWLFLLYSLTLTIPCMLQLGLRTDNRRRMYIGLTVVAVLLACLSIYIGLQLLPVGQLYDHHITFNFICSMTVLCFFGQSYLQRWADRQSNCYAPLFQSVWRNLFILLLSMLFTLIVWVLMMLWAELFKLIGIDFFRELFRRIWFYNPVLALAFAGGILLFRSLESLLDTLVSLLRVFSQWLLPLLVIMAVLFLLALPFTGLQALWNTGKGTVLVLSLQGGLLFFLNAVYQCGDRRVYGLWLHRIIYAGCLLLPVFSLIAAYGLYLRIQQYGFTVERGWALMIWAFLASLALSYGWQILRRWDAWPTAIGRTNSAIGILLIISLILLNSPVLDFRKISANDQVARYEENHDVNAIDPWYLFYHLGRSGYLAAEQLKQQYKDDDALILALADNQYHGGGREVDEGLLQQSFERQLSVYPPQAEIPDGLLEALYNARDEWRGNQQIGRYLFMIDLNNDQQADPVFIEDHDSWASASLWQQRGIQWQSRRLYIEGEWSLKTLQERMNNVEPQVITPTWDNLKIDDLVIWLQGGF
ncbi:DUF4153 domain-containing protein [Gynuella sunshinyii]|uniref:DUF4153 domain-containing protein n=1 Tax=Gynuella sunshinyii YC6258 TaxID=1445510 RepID=A0A0C5V1C0_9GAMM|nr:DUF4153 domain-containing protein [Gynuella sunshinyii]AJQ93305.1 hypothetical Protein YC6258_01257 [Gynuella sunshinyii YC6258]